jgi:hypothetical protein
MGLDMYLYADIYVSKEKFAGPRAYVENPTYNKIIQALDLDPTNLDGGFKVQANIGYWRKANAIHMWFVNECAGGIDECQEINVYQDKLVELQKKCKQVLDADDALVADAVLPTGAGFFFGSLMYDEWYYKDLTYTIELIDKAIALPHTDNFIYQASW